MARDRAELERVIAGGGTVLHGGRAITDRDNLPSVVELAGKDVSKRQFALGNLKAKAEAAQAEVAAAEAEAAALAAAEKSEGDAAPEGGPQPLQETPPAPRGRR